MGEGGGKKMGEWLRTLLIMSEGSLTENIRGGKNVESRFYSVTSGAAPKRGKGRKVLLNRLAHKRGHE